MSERSISAGIVNHDGARYLEATIEALKRSSPAVDDVVLADNASSDGGVDLARRLLPSLRVVAMGANLGPAAARNAILRQARHDRVLLLDNDAVVLPGCVEALSGALDDDPRAVVAMPAVRYAARPDTVQYAGAEPHFLGTCRLLSADEPLDRLDRRLRRVGSVVTCCALADRGRFGDRPWFDETFFIYLEDHEFGLRARLLGFDLLAVPAAECLHGAGTIGLSIRETGGFSRVRVRHTIRNRWQVLLKLYRGRTLLRIFPALAAFELLQLAGSVYRGWLGSWLWAAGSLALMLPDLLRRRRAFGRERRLDDLEVLTGGPFPFHPLLHESAAERFARRVLDAVVAWNWRITGGRK